MNDHELDDCPVCQALRREEELTEAQIAVLFLFLPELPERPAA
jgi:hypothetical protein